MTTKKIKLVISDLHLGTGIRKGQFNPIEEFYADDRIAEWLTYYCEEAYNEDVEIELILNGDIFDLLKVPVGNKWIDEITTEISIDKLKRCLLGHPVFCNAIERFLERDLTKLTVIPGNHDIDLILPEVQQVFLEHCAPGELKDKVFFLTNSETYYLPEGIQIRHGNQLEAANKVDIKMPLKDRKNKKPILKLPWGSIFIIKVLAPAKLERYHIDHINPFLRLLIGGLFFDFRFTMKIILMTIYYFFKTRIKDTWSKPQGWKQSLQIIKDEFLLPFNYDDLVEKEIKKIRGVHTFIYGHSHQPRCKMLPDGKLYINTGTWIKMINIDLHHLGQESGFTYALIEFEENELPRTNLLKWNGRYKLKETIYYSP